MTEKKLATTMGCVIAAPAIVGMLISVVIEVSPTRPAAVPAPPPTSDDLLSSLYALDAAVAGQIQDVEAEVAAMEKSNDVFIGGLLITGVFAAVAIPVYHTILRRWPLTCATCGENLVPGGRYVWILPDGASKTVCAKCNAAARISRGEDPADELAGASRGG